MRGVGTAILVGLAVITSACSPHSIVTGTDGSQSCVGPAETFTSPAASMEPTIGVGQRFTVDQGAYRAAMPKQGDIVVFATPPKEVPIIMVKNLVKRVIGLPGTTISSGPHGEVLIDGMAINQPWLSAGAKSDPGPPIREQRISSHELFVMGDNRGDSVDSRFYGPIRISSVVGQVKLSGCH